MWLKLVTVLGCVGVISSCEIFPTCIDCGPAVVRACDPTGADSITATVPASGGWTCADYAGVLIDSTALAGNTVVTIQRIPFDTSCIQSPFRQFDGCYNFTFSQTLLAPVLVGICYNTDSIAPFDPDTLRLATFDTLTSTTITLERDTLETSPLGELLAHCATFVTAARHTSAAWASVLPDGFLRLFDWGRVPAGMPFVHLGWGGRAPALLFVPSEPTPFVWTVPETGE